MMPAAVGEDFGFDRRYEGDTGIVNGVRQDVDRWLRSQSADDDTRERAALVISELASNAVQASPGRAFEMSLRRTPIGVCITVVNQAEDAAVPDRRDWGPDDVLAPTGRGLAIVDALCVRVSIETSDSGEVCVEADLVAAFGSGPSSP